MTETETGCHCASCAQIHAEFIAHFGRWPNMTHAEAEQLALRRVDNERSWQEALQ